MYCIIYLSAQKDIGVIGKMIKTVNVNSIHAGKGHGEDFLSQLKKTNFPETRPEGFEFGDGVNFVVGDCGSGKSTLLNIITRALACNTGGYTKHSYQYEKQNDANGCYSAANEVNNPDYVSVDWDGSETFYYNSARSFGLESGHFVDGFISEGIMNMRFEHGSQGEYNMHRMLAFIEKCLTGKQKTDLAKLKTLSTYPKENPQLQKKPTLIIDEPERSMSHCLQFKFFNMLFETFSEYQIIIVTHSPTYLYFLKTLKNVTLIETSEGYTEDLTAYMRSVVGAVNLPSTQGTNE